MRLDVRSLVTDTYDDLCAYSAFVGAVVEVVDALERVRRASEEGGAHSVVLRVSVPRPHGPWGVMIETPVS